MTGDTMETVEQQQQTEPEVTVDSQPMTVEVHVTEDLIKDHDEMDPCHCPMAAALKAAGFRGVCVGGPSDDRVHFGAGLDGPTPFMTLSDDAKEGYDAFFDHRKEGYPFSFEVEVKDEWIDEGLWSPEATDDDAY